MLSEIQNSVGDFSVISLPESDAHLNSNFEVDFEQHLLLRRWPGTGSYAYPVLVHRSWTRYLAEIRNEGRAVCLTCRVSRREEVDVIFAR